MHARTLTRTFIRAHACAHAHVQSRARAHAHNLMPYLHDVWDVKRVVLLAAVRRLAYVAPHLLPVVQLCLSAGARQQAGSCVWGGGGACGAGILLNEGLRRVSYP